jgi:hypothetical protein
MMMSSGPQFSGRSSQLGDGNCRASRTSPDSTSTLNIEVAHTTERLTLLGTITQKSHTDTEKSPIDRAIGNN